MIFHERIFDAGQGALNGRGLRDDIDTIGVLLDHLLQAADLAFDDAQTLDECLMVVFHMLLAYTPQGYMSSGRSAAAPSGLASLRRQWYTINKIIHFSV